MLQALKPDGRTLAAAAIALCAVGALHPVPHRAVRAAVRVEPRDPAERAMTLALAEDVWSEHAGEPLVVVLGEAALDRLRVPHSVIVADLDAAADTERARLAHRASAADWFAEYRDLDELDAYMARLAAQHPSRVHLRTLGTSVEGRPIRALEISDGGTLGIALDGGQHAREWLSVMVPMCIADRLATASDPRIRDVLHEVRFTIAPLVNPDGYHYTWTADRYWRKSRRGGYGVDLNRNFSVGWGGAGSSGDRESPNYRGESAFSEPETQAVRSLFESTAIAAHVDFHSYSQLILYPWSHQRSDPPDRDAFAAIADRMSTAMEQAHGVRYAIRAGADLRIGAGGTAADWSYAEHGALAFLIELRPASRADGGFVLPPEQIVPSCDESLAGVLALAEWMIAHRR